MLLYYEAQSRFLQLSAKQRTQGPLPLKPGCEEHVGKLSLRTEGTGPERF